MTFTFGWQQWLILVFAVFTLTTSSYLLGHHIGADDAKAAAKAEALADFQSRTEAAQKIADDLRQKAAAAAAENEKLKGQIANEIAKNPVYASCIVPHSGVQLLNKTIAGNSAKRSN